MWKYNCGNDLASQESNRLSVIAYVNFYYRKIDMKGRKIINHFNLLKLGCFAPALDVCFIRHTTHEHTHEIECV